MDKASDRILTTIKNILDSTSKDLKDEMMDLNVNEVVEEEFEFFKGLDAELRYDVTTELRLESKQTIWAAHSHISQVIANLIKNSADAMLPSDTKKLTISTFD